MAASVADGDGPPRGTGPAKRATVWTAGSMMPRRPPPRARLRPRAVGPIGPPNPAPLANRGPTFAPTPKYNGRCRQAGASSILDEPDEGTGGMNNQPVHAN